MRGYITADRYETVYDLPIQLPQTELRRGRYIIFGTVSLGLGQVLRVRCFNLHLINILTPSAIPNIFSTPLGVVSAGVFTTPMMCSGALLMRAASPGVVGFNSFQYRDFGTPGNYYFAISNNTTNIDVSAAVTGTCKIFNG